MDHGSKIFRAALDLQTENDFAAARAVGANEALKFFGREGRAARADGLSERPSVTTGLEVT